MNAECVRVRVHREGTPPVYQLPVEYSTCCSVCRWSGAL